MKELGRILSGRLVLALTAILLVNGFLFAWAQEDRGLDPTLPSPSVVFLDGSVSMTEEPVDPQAAYRRYEAWLDRVRDLPLEGAAALLSDEREALAEKIRSETAAGDDRLDYVAVNNLLSRVDYLSGYGGWLDSIQANKENLLNFSLFNDPNSFSGRNVLKTAAEFEKLAGVTLALGADGAVEALLNFSLTDYFLVLFLLLVCLAFLEERKAGLWSVVHATARGRLPLAMQRTLILLLSSVCAVALLYGTDLGIGFWLYGGQGDLGRPAQSVEALGKLPLLCSVGGFLVRYLLLRAAAAFFVGLLLWLMLTAGGSGKYALVAAAAVLAVEYGFYTFLPVQSAFNILKYFNLFTYIRLTDLYVNYLNIDLFGFPLGIRSISQAALVPLCLLTAWACVALNCRKEPAGGRDLLGSVAYSLNQITDQVLGRLGLLGMELHKTLWIQKGVGIVALLVYVAVGLSFTVPVPAASAEERTAREFRNLFIGEITDDTFARMDAMDAEYQRAISAYDQAQEAYLRGEIDYAQLNACSQDAAAAKSQSEGLALVRDRAEELRALGAERHFTPWIIDDTPFESVYGARAQNNQHRAATVAVLALALLLAGSLAYDRRSGMTALLRATYRGRGALLIRKVLLAALMTALVWAVVYGIELYTLLTAFSVTTWAAPVQNMSMLAGFPLPCSIAGWLVFLYACRWGALFCGAMIVLFLSSRLRRMEAAYLATSAVLLLPSLLYAFLGVNALGPVSYIVCVEVMPLLLQADGGLLPLLLRGGVLAGMAGVSVAGIMGRREK